MSFLRLCLCFVASINWLSAQLDRFDDGDDFGWSPLDPLGELGAGPFAKFVIENQSYRLSSAESPSPFQAGPARAASLRQEVVHTDRFFICVDLVIPDTSLEQSAGFLAFVQPDPSLGTTSGYSLNYQPVANDLILNLVMDEQPIRLALSPLTASAGPDLRLVFICENGRFTGKLFNLDDLLNPIAVVSATDSTYTSGTAGLFVFADTSDATGVADAVFDNYHANALLPPALDLEVVGKDDYELKWPTWAAHFQAEINSDLKSNTWMTLSEDPPVRGGHFVIAGKFSKNPSAYFRLNQSRDLADIPLPPKLLHGRPYK